MLTNEMYVLQRPLQVLICAADKEPSATNNSFVFPFAAVINLELN